LRTRLQALLIRYRYRARYRPGFRLRALLALFYQAICGKGHSAILDLNGGRHRTSIAVGAPADPIIAVSKFKFGERQSRPDDAQLMKRFPPSSFYHWADPANLLSIRQHGLLSTERLLDLAGLNSDERAGMLSQYRPNQVELPNGIVIRDQSPMPPSLLARALQPGVTPPDWYRLLNSFVFLWASFERAERHRLAFSRKSQVLLIFDAASLLRELGGRVLLSPINSGNARRRPAPRSPRLFVPYPEWSVEGWPVIAGQQRSRSVLPAEIILEGHLPLEPFLTGIQEMAEVNQSYRF
jgi:hypothetical protein